jgi:hypothetical protein
MVPRRKACLGTIGQRIVGDAEVKEEAPLTSASPT